MVKITSSTIDIYTVPSTAPLQRRQFLIEPKQQTPNAHTSMLGRKNYRRYSVDASELLSDSSDSETSFFDDSDDNDDVTAFFGKHGSRYSNIRDGDRIPTSTHFVKERNQLNKKKHTNSSRNVHASCEILNSPRLNRKTIKTSRTTSSLHQRTNSIENSILGTQPPVRNYSVPNLNTISSSNKINMENTYRHRVAQSLTENELNRNNSACLLSPRLRRKPVDITKSTAYKEIYAHNLRLYSEVMAKQVASSGQVGREMNQIRRNKLKERARCNDKTTPSTTKATASGNFKRSQSFAAPNHSNVSSTVDTNVAGFTRNKRSNSADTEMLNQQIHQSGIMNACNDLKKKSSSDEDIMHSNAEDFTQFRKRTQSLVPPKEILKRIASQTMLNENENNANETDDGSEAMNENETVPEQRSVRSEAAYRRKEQLQQKLESFNCMFEKTTDFLAKVKTMRKL